MKASKLFNLWKFTLLISLAINVLLFVWVYQLSSDDSKSANTAEEVSGIQDFKYRVPCNAVFGYEVCVSDFVGLDEGEATYKAKTHGLTPVINSRDGKVLFGYVSDEPFRINFKIEKELVVQAFFQ
jgi:hypothetical protein